MRLKIAVVMLVLLLAACGGRPEPVVLPTVAFEATEAVNDTAATVTPPPRSIPTLPPPRDTVQRTSARQVAVVSAAGAVNAELLVENEIYIADVQGRSARMTTNAGVDRGAVWSPDGDTLYFTSDGEGTAYIYTLNVSNTNPVQRLSPFPSGDEREPTLAPTGAEIAFTSDRTGSANIYRMNAFDGRGLQTLTTGEGVNTQPTWSPDNTWIAFVSERDGNAEIYAMTTTGEQITRLTDNPATDTQPAFSPDGRRLAFISDRDGAPQVYLMNLPEPRPAFEDDRRGQSFDLLSGDIPPLDLSTEESAPDIIRVTGDNDRPKEHPGWYVTAEGRMGLVYTAVVAGTDGEQRRQTYLANDDGSNVQTVGGLQGSFTQGAVRPLQR